MVSLSADTNYHGHNNYFLCLNLALNEVFDNFPVFTSFDLPSLHIVIAGNNSELLAIVLVITTNFLTQI